MSWLDKIICSKIADVQKHPNVTLLRPRANVTLLWTACRTNFDDLQESQCLWYSVFWNSSWQFHAVPTSVISEQMDMERTCCVLCCYATCITWSISWPLQSPQQLQLEEWIATHQPVKVYETSMIQLHAIWIDLMRTILFQSILMCSHMVCMVCTATPSHWPCYLEDPPEERQDANKVMILYRYLQIFMNLIFLIFWCVPSDTNSCEVWRNRVHV